MGGARQILLAGLLMFSAGAPSAADPFMERAAQYSSRDDGKTPVHPLPVTGENTRVFIVAGQSLAGNTSQGNYTPVNSKVHDLFVFSGGMFAAADPITGVSQAVDVDKRANVFTRVADQLITAGTFQRVILCQTAQGGTQISEWVSTYHRQILWGLRRAARHGYTNMVVIWQQGESEPGTSQADYTSRFNSLKAIIAAEFPAVKWIVGKSTYTPGGVTSAPVRAAQAAVVDGVTVFAGADTDSLTGVTNRYDDQHWNATGNAAAAVLWKNAIQAAVSAGL